MICKVKLLKDKNCKIILDPTWKYKSIQVYKYSSIQVQFDTWSQTNNLKARDSVCRIKYTSISHIGVVEPDMVLDTKPIGRHGYEFDRRMCESEALYFEWFTAQKVSL